MEILLLSGVVIAPLVVLPFFTSFITSSKVLALLVTAIIFLIVFVWKTLRTQTITVPRSPLVLPLVLFGASVAVSSILTTPYPMENLLMMGGIYISTIILTVVGASYLKPNSQHRFLNTLYITAALTAVAAVAEYFGYGPSRILNQVIPLNFPNNNSFNLSGSLFIAAQFLGIALVGSVAQFVKTRKMSLIQVVTTPLIVIGLLLSISELLPGKANAPVILPFTSSWQVAAEGLKTPRTALIGFGPEHYSDAFQRFRPVTLNTTPLWSVIFSQGMNVPLTLVPTLGLLGLGLWIFLSIKTANVGLASFKEQPGLSAIIIAGLIMQLLLPPSFITVWVLAIALAYLIANQPQARNVMIHLFKISYFDSETTHSRSGLAALLPYALPTLVCLLLGFALFRPLAQSYAASHFFLRSILAQQNNDLVGMYTNQQRATALNRFMSFYRSNFAITSLTASNALLTKKDATEADKQQANQLAQQAINEARAATGLRPLDSQTWQTLGQIYATLHALKAEGADQWTLLAYTQAIQNNPTNPILRLQLGAFLFDQKRYNDAALLFDQALGLKPDLTPAAYRLGVTLKQLNDLPRARVAYQRTLELLQPDSEDYKLAQKELAEIEAQLAEAEKKNQQAGGKNPQPTDSSQPTKQPLPSVVNENLNQSNDDAIDTTATETLPTSLNTTENSSPSAQTP